MMIKTDAGGMKYGNAFETRLRPFRRDGTRNFILSFFGAFE
jgi:hypothetical protein